MKKSFRNDSKIKTISHKIKKKLTEFVTSSPALREVIKEVLRAERKLYHRDTWNSRNEEVKQRMVNIWVNIIGSFSLLLKHATVENKNYNIL